MNMVACGWRHTISVSVTGGLYTYGWSKYGQLGHGDFEDHLVPYKVEALADSSIKQVTFWCSHLLVMYCKKESEVLTCSFHVKTKKHGFHMSYHVSACSMIS